MKIAILGVCAALFLTTGANAQPIERGAVIGPVGYGNVWFNERDRLARQAYDYYYRNSNNNVYRNSRHFSPTQNVFRSSRHYQQKLRAANDGYPIRSFSQITERIGDGEPFVRSFSWAYHNPHPLDRYGRGGGCGGYDGYGGGFPVNQNLVRVADIQWERPQATDSPIVQKITFSSGTQKTIIVSMPDDPDIDDAWQLLAAGAGDTAAGLFAQFTGGDRGAEARLGQSLALAEKGDVAEASRLLEEATLADAAIAGNPSQWAPLYPVLENILERVGSDDEAQPIRGVVEAMLGRTDVVIAE